MEAVALLVAASKSRSSDGGGAEEADSQAGCCAPRAQGGKITSTGRGGNTA